LGKVEEGLCLIAVKVAFVEENTAEEGRIVAQWAYRPWGASGVAMCIQVLVGTS
jgi:hypothetical protein